MNNNYLEYVRDAIYENILSVRLEDLKLAAAYAVLTDVMQRDVDASEKALAAGLVFLETFSYLSENTSIDINGKKVKLSTISDNLGIAGEIYNFRALYKTAISELNDPRNIEGKLSPETISGVFLSVSNIADSIIDVVASRFPSVPAKILQILSKAINISLAYWNMNAESLQEAIDSNIENIEALGSHLEAELNERTGEYISFYNNALQSAADISGLSVAELSQGPEGLPSPVQMLENLADDVTGDLRDRLKRAKEIGLNESYEEAKLQVETWIGEGEGDKGQFDRIAEWQLTGWLKSAYGKALDKIQADILSDTHNDTLSTINAQLAGIIDGYSHIDEADKAAILAGWQQKFAGEFALERNGSDAQLLDEIARLKAEMARLGAGEGTSILDMPNPAETLAALMEQQDAALTATMQDYLAGFLGEFTDYVAGVDERQQQRDAIASTVPEGMFDVESIFSDNPGGYNREEWINRTGIRTAYNETRYYYINETTTPVIDKAIYYDGNYFEAGLEHNIWNYMFHGGNYGDYLLTSEEHWSRINGFKGDDTIVVRDFNSIVDGGEDNDTVIVDSEYTSPGSVVKITGGTGSDTITSAGAQVWAFLDSNDGFNDQALDGKDYAATSWADDLIDQGEITSGHLTTTLIPASSTASR